MKKQISHLTDRELILIAGCSREGSKVYPLTPGEVREYIEAWAFINTDYRGEDGLGIEFYVDIKIEGTWENARTKSSVDIPEYDKPEQYVELRKKNFSVWCRPQNGWTQNKKFARYNLRPVDGINSWGKSYITITKKGQ